MKTLLIILTSMAFGFGSLSWAWEKLHEAANYAGDGGPNLLHFFSIAGAGIVGLISGLIAIVMIVRWYASEPDEK